MVFFSNLDEIQELEIALKDSIKILKVNGMMLFVTFHSLEDRPVKRACSVINVDKKYKKFILPSEEEITDNVRSRSAKLRVAVKASAVIEEVVVEEEAENLTLRDLRRQGRIRKNKMIQEGERLDRLELELDDDRMI